VAAKFVAKFLNIFIYLLYSIKSLLDNTLKRNPLQAELINKFGDLLRGKDCSSPTRNFC